MFTILSNHWLYDCQRGSKRLLNGVIFGDTVILTGMLYFTGGVNNPFSGFYLLLIALAAMVLSGRALCWLLFFSTASVLVLYRYHVPLSGPSWVANDGRLTYPVFLLGWGISLFLIAGCIAFFIHRMNLHLRERESALVEAERQANEAHQFQALATLAAGVAHELGSPLGTIATERHLNGRKMPA